MKAEITFSQLYWNPSILGFFFTTQAEKTLNELMEKVIGFQYALDRIEDYCNEMNIDADELGDLFHEMTVEELAEEFSIELREENEEE